VRKLILKDLSVRDVSGLAGVHDLTLSMLSGLVDVSALASVHTLTLEELGAVEDVSALSSVHSLTLMDLPRVTDVSALGSGNVYRLALARLALCAKQFDSEGPLGGGVAELSLREVRVADLRVFARSRCAVYQPRLHGGAWCPPLAPLLALDRVTLHSLLHTTTEQLSALDGARFRRLTLVSVPKLVALPDLRAVHRVDIVHAVALSDVSGVRGVREVRLRYVHVLTDVRPLSDALTVHLWGCAELTDVRSLRDVHTLLLSQLPRLHGGVVPACVRSAVPELSAFNLSGRHTECAYAEPPFEDLRSPEDLYLDDPYPLDEDDEVENSGFGLHHYPDHSPYPEYVDEMGQFADQHYALQHFDGLLSGGGLDVGDGLADPNGCQHYDF
jgi:hypothetical protein